VIILYRCGEAFLFYLATTLKTHAYSLSNALTKITMSAAYGSSGNVVQEWVREWSLKALSMISTGARLGDYLACAVAIQSNTTLVSGWMSIKKWCMKKINSKRLIGPQEELGLWKKFGIQLSWDMSIFIHLLSEPSRASLYLVQDGSSISKVLLC
jgi:hypothetical protein